MRIALLPLKKTILKKPQHNLTGSTVSTNTTSDSSSVLKYSYSPIPTTVPTSNTIHPHLNEKHQQQPHHHHLIFYCHVRPDFLLTRKQSKKTNFQKRAEKLTTWSRNKWHELSNAPEGTWKHKTFMFANKLLDRIPPDEWFLRHIPTPQQLPDLKNMKETIKVWHPSTISSTQSKEELQKILIRAKPIHKKHLYICIACLPFSFLFSVMPGPNLPLAYNAFRLFCHYRALKGIETLNLIQNKIEYVHDKNSFDQCFAKEYHENPSVKDGGNVGFQNDGRNNNLLVEDLYFDPIESPNKLIQFGIGDDGLKEYMKRIQRHLFIICHKN